MSKPLEALEYLKANTYIKQDKYSMEALHYIEQALTPPTEKEVCEALNEYLKYKVFFDKENKVFYSLYPETSSTIVNKFYVTKRNEFHNTYGIVVALPPHLITLIGKFYESLEDK